MRYTQPGTYKTTVDEINPTPDGEGLSVHLGELVHGYLTTTIIVQPPKGSPGGPPANQPPTASFTAGDAYTERDTTFDASGSTDGDGSVVKYEWDWEADGTYDETHTTPTTTHKYEFGGPHTVRLRVTDDDGATGTTANTIQVCDCVPPAKVIAREAAGLSAARAGVPFKLKLDQLKLTPGITTVGGSRLVTGGVRAHGRFRLSRAPRLLVRPRSVRWASVLSFTQHGNGSRAKVQGEGYLLLALSKKASVCLAAKATGTLTKFNGKLAVAGGRGRGAHLRGTGSFGPPVPVGGKAVLKGRLKFRKARKPHALPRSCRSLARALPAAGHATSG
jgi:hypothetical protein